MWKETKESVSLVELGSQIRFKFLGSPLEIPIPHSLCMAAINNSIQNKLNFRTITCTDRAGTYSSKRGNRFAEWSQQSRLRNEHLTNVGLSRDPKCNCNFAEETSLLIIFEWTTFSSLRLRILRNYTSTLTRT